jgi:hypothetical protein
MFSLNYLNYEAKSELQEKKNCAFFAQNGHFYVPKFGK